MEKNEILYKSFQLIVSKQMDSDNVYEVIYCPEENEYRLYCNCDKLCKERFYKNHLNSQTHTNNIRENILHK